MTDGARPAFEAPRAESPLRADGTHVGMPSAASDLAPFIFFDVASTWGICSGVAAISLDVRRLTNTPSGVRRDFVTVAHLRMSIEALLQLRDAIDAIELLARAAPRGSTN